MHTGSKERDDFVDYYELMQISPNADVETIQRVYRMLAARYHPDNPESGDAERFLRLNEAYRHLSVPDRRATYDISYNSRTTEPIRIFEMREFAEGLEGESNRRMGLLCLLYNRRRTNPEHPGLSVLELETMMWFPREHLVFTIWYLKEKGYIRQDDQSNLMITAEGTDYVEENLPTNKIMYKLLKAAELGATRSEEQTWAAGEREETPSAKEA